MEHYNEIVCFTDLVKSTDYTEEKGHVDYDKYYEEHLRVGKEILKMLHGEYVKNIGDAHLIRFRNPMEALKFAVLFQQYHQDQVCVSLIPFKVRISLFLGTVSESKQGDIIGEGVNKSARLEGIAGAGEILVNKGFYESVSNILGKNETRKYFQSRGKQRLKGISRPVEIYSFQWAQFLKTANSVKFNLSKYIKDFFDSLSIITSNLFLDDLSKSSYVIWPVVPRDIVNAIHRAQIEILRLLALLGWKVLILIADCGANENPRKEYSQKFQSKIINYSSKRNLKELEFYFLSDLFDPNYEKYKSLQAIFQNVISNLTLQDLLNINNKEYDENVKMTIKRSATLDFLRPALTISAVLHLARRNQNKCIVVAGEDEKIQWITSHDLPGSRENLGVILNPIIKKNHSQLRQTKNWPFWDSWQNLYDDMEDSNLAEWLIRLYLFLPKFPITELTINKKVLNINDKFDLDRNDKRMVAKLVYDGLLSLTH